MSTISRLLTIVVVHLVIWVLSEISQRYVPELNKKHYFGVYLILMPVGFSLFGWNLPYWAIAIFELGGLASLFRVFKHTLHLSRSLR